MIIIGIDPGYHIGIAVFLNGKLTELRTLPNNDLAEFRDWFDSFIYDQVSWDTYHFVVECTHNDPARFRASQDKSAYGIRRADSTSSGIVEFIRGWRRGINHYEMIEIHIHELKPPRKGERLSKVRPAMFAQLFPEYNGRSSEHSRDAALHARDWLIKEHLTQKEVGECFGE